MAAVRTSMEAACSKLVAASGVAMLDWRAAAAEDAADALGTGNSMIMSIDAIRIQIMTEDESMPSPAASAMAMAI